MPITDIPASRRLRPSRVALGVVASLVLHGAAVSGLVLWQASEPQLELGRGGMQATWIELGELTLPPPPPEGLPAVDDNEIPASEPEPAA
jgi:periplasmic protein TonB